MWLPRHRNAPGHPCGGRMGGAGGGGEASIFKILMSVPISLNEDSIPLDGARPLQDDSANHIRGTPFPNKATFLGSGVRTSP